MCRIPAIGNHVRIKEWQRERSLTLVGDMSFKFLSVRGKGKRRTRINGQSTLWTVKRVCGLQKRERPLDSEQSFWRSR